MSKTPKPPSTPKANKNNFHAEGSESGQPDSVLSTETAKHKHDFQPNGDYDAGRPVLACSCGERRVEGNPGATR